MKTIYMVLRIAKIQKMRVIDVVRHVREWSLFFGLSFREEVELYYRACFEEAE